MEIRTADEAVAAFFPSEIPRPMSLSGRIPVVGGLEEQSRSPHGADQARLGGPDVFVQPARER